MKRNKLVKCHECKHLIEEADAQIVCIENPFYFYSSTNLIFCPEHKKPYDRVYTSVYGGTKTFQKRIGWIEVDESGEYVGYVKKVDKKGK